MKAIVNIGFRKVKLIYKINKDSLIPEIMYKNWEDCYLEEQNDKILCEQGFWFNDSDEWKQLFLFDGRIVDFHYDYEIRAEFESKNDWCEYIFQGYVYGESRNCDNNIIEKVTVTY